MITVLFSCKSCGVEKERVRCKGRMSPDSDLLWWIRNVVTKAVAKGHKRASPGCPSIHVDLYLPTTTPEGRNLLWVGQDEAVQFPETTNAPDPEGVETAPFSVAVLAEIKTPSLVMSQTTTADVLE